MVSWLATPWAAAKAVQRDGLSLQDHDPLPPSVCSWGSKGETWKKEPTAKQDETKTALSQTSLKIRTH